MSKIQSILFDNRVYSPKQAQAWLWHHNIDPIKHVHKTNQWLRYRIEEPSPRYDYRNIRITDDGAIRAIISVPNEYTNNPRLQHAGHINY